jgi:hypothetical protein
MTCIYFTGKGLKLKFSKQINKYSHMPLWIKGDGAKDPDYAEDVAIAMTTSDLGKKSGAGTPRPELLANML